MESVRQFQEILARAVVAERVDPYGWDLSRYGAELIESVRSHPSDQAILEGEFISLVDSGEPGAPFLEFCMHALRWSAVRIAIEERHRAAIDRNDFRAEPYYRHLLESFTDGWDDANDIYAGYFRVGT
jgi:hypothetical protein